MKRLVVCVYWHYAPYEPSRLFPAVDRALLQLTELGGRRLTWGADRYAFEFEPAAVETVLHAALKLIVDLANHSVGMALRELAFHKTPSGVLCAGGLSLALAEALAVAAGPGQALVDPEIDVAALGLSSVKQTPVELRDLSVRAATLIPGLSSVHEIFDAPVLPRPQRAPSPVARTSVTPAPPSALRGPVSQPPRPTASQPPRPTPSRAPRPDTTSVPPGSMRPAFSVSRVPHPPRPGSVPPVLVRPPSAPPPLKRTSATPMPATALPRRSSTPPPPPLRASASLPVPAPGASSMVEAAEELDASELIELEPASKAPPPRVRPSQPPAAVAPAEPETAPAAEVPAAPVEASPPGSEAAAGERANGKKRRRRRKRRKESPEAPLETSNSPSGA